MSAGVGTGAYPYGNEEIAGGGSSGKGSSGVRDLINSDTYFSISDAFKTIRVVDRFATDWYVYR